MTMVKSLDLPDCESICHGDRIQPEHDVKHLTLTSLDVGRPALSCETHMHVPDSCGLHQCCLFCLSDPFGTSVSNHHHLSESLKFVC